MCETDFCGRLFFGPFLNALSHILLDEECFVSTKTLSDGCNSITDKLCDFLQIVNLIRDSAMIWTNFRLNIWTIILNWFIFKWAYKTALSKGKWQKWRNVFLGFIATFLWSFCCYGFLFVLVFRVCFFLVFMVLLLL